MAVYVQPKLGLKAFNCPHCNAYSNQNWVTAQFGNYLDNSVTRARCVHCSVTSHWIDDRMVYPDNTNFPKPNLDLNEDIIKDYNEAGAIADRSPRGACALLRLCIQKLCVQLGEPGKNINEDIKNLVKKGLSERIQKMLDIVRVIGNESVHPGEMSLDDNVEIAKSVALLINQIADEMITKPKELENLYNSLPAKALKGISDRDKK